MPQFAKVTALQERQYEKKHIFRQRERYLATDVISKAEMDPGYAEKLQQIEAALGDTRGWVLDVGANTCGESEFLTTRGYSIIATDINEVALDISQERCARYQRGAPHYLACDGHRLPLADRCIQFVILNEALHHMDDPGRTMREVSRVLAPGGRVFLYEPYAFNPYRRLSEIRDRFRGTIERSFSISRLRRILTDAGLSVVSLRRHTCSPSEWKMATASSFRKRLKRIYHRAQITFPRVFGNLVVVGQKPGQADAQLSRPPIASLLRCPVSGSALVPVDQDWLISPDENFRGAYAVYRGIPVLIAEELKQLDPATWLSLLDRTRNPQPVRPAAS